MRFLPAVPDVLLEYSIFKYIMNIYSKIILGLQKNSFSPATLTSYPKGPVSFDKDRP
jgi:hypothetical protein